MDPYELVSLDGQARKKMKGDRIKRQNISSGSKLEPVFGYSRAVKFDRFIPGFHFHLPLDDDLKWDLDFVLGLNVGYRLP